HVADLARRLLADLADLDVDLACRPLAVVALGLVAVGAEEAGAAALVEVDAAQAAHAELLDHAAGDAADLLQVARRAVGDFAVDQLLRQRAAQRHLDAALQL